MNFSLFKGKSRRTLVFSLITLFSVVILLAGNIVLTYFTPIRSIYLDMTEENLYTMSESMKTETGFLDTLSEDEIEIIFCNDPDVLTSSLATRVTYFMARQLEEKYPAIKVKTVNPTLNPTALSAYKANSLTTIDHGDVIVASGDRYRISSANKFWMFDGDEFFSYNGEYHMVSMLKSVTAINQPKAYFVTGHGETIYDPDNPDSAMSLSMQSFKDLLAERGLEVAKLDLSIVSDVPDDCALLIINDPREPFKTEPDKYSSLYYTSEIDKLDRYLIKKQGAIMVAKDYEVEIPVLEEFLYEWGIEFGSYLVKDEVSSLKDETDSNTKLIAEYSKDEESYSYAIYGEFAAMSSAPRMVFANAGYLKCTYNESNAMAEPGTSNTTRHYANFVSTSPNAKPYALHPETGEYVDLAGYAGSYNLAALVVRNRVDEKDNTNEMSYLFCVNTADFFKNELLGNSYYANYDVVSSLIDNISRFDAYASSDLGGPSLNSTSYGGKQLHNSYLSEEDVLIYSSDAKDVIETNYAISGGIKAFIIAVALAAPTVALIFGVVVIVRRRFL